jgi:protocatechuate 3,4-dioxygenase beta subunit
LFVTGCAGAAPLHRPSEGSIAGLARDRESGEPVAHADIRVRAEGELAPRSTTTNANGGYALSHLSPGRYSLDAEFAGQPIDIEHIDVHAGGTTLVDVTFTLGQPDRVRIDFGDPQMGAIAHYRPRHLGSRDAILEGTLTDTATRAPVAGASVTATAAGTTLQAVTDDLGRFRFDAVAPGAYTVSAYYSIAGRGQMEVRRSDISVGAGDGVIVPLWVELEKP